MKSIFDEGTYNEILYRLAHLSENSPRLWGKMNPAQVLAHCNKPIEYYLGRKPLKPSRNFILKLFKPILYNDMPFGKGAATHKEFVVSGVCIFETEKEKLLVNLQEMKALGESF